jgi:hypothetical protein
VFPIFNWLKDSWHVKVVCHFFGGGGVGGGWSISHELSMFMGLLILVSSVYSFYTFFLVYTKYFAEGSFFLEKRLSDPNVQNVL